MSHNKSCARCTYAPLEGSANYPSFLKSGEDLGLIHGIHESLTTASLFLLLNSYDVPRDQAEYRRCKSRYERRLNVPDSELKLRPCVLMPQKERNGIEKGAYKICIGATLGHAEYEKLPKLYKHFFIPVYPNPHCAEAPHLHTIPEWNNPHQWIFAYRWDTTRSLEIWHSPSTAPTSDQCGDIPSTVTPYRLDEKSLSLLQSECRKREAEWEARCYRNWRYAIQVAQDWRINHMNASMASIASNTSICTRDTVRIGRSRLLLDTLHEEADAASRSSDRLTKDSQKGPSSHRRSIHRGRMSVSSSALSFRNTRIPTSPSLA